MVSRRSKWMRLNIAMAIVLRTLNRTTVAN